MIFYPRLLPQLSEKRDKKEQSMEKKNAKTSFKTAE